MLVLNKLNGLLKVVSNGDDRTIIKSFKTTIEGYYQKGYLLNREILPIKRMLQKLNQRKVIDLKMLSTLEMSFKAEKVSVESYKQQLDGTYIVEIINDEHVDFGTIKIEYQDLEDFNKSHSNPYVPTEYLSKAEETDLVQDYLNY